MGMCSIIIMIKRRPSYSLLAGARGNENRLEEVRADNKPAEAPRDHDQPTKNTSRRGSASLHHGQGVGLRKQLPKSQNRHERASH